MKLSLSDDFDGQAEHITDDILYRVDISGGLAEEKRYNYVQITYTVAYIFMLIFHGVIIAETFYEQNRTDAAITYISGLPVLGLHCLMFAVPKSKPAKRLIAKYFTSLEPIKEEVERTTRILYYICCICVIDTIAFHCFVLFCSERSIYNEKVIRGTLGYAAYYVYCACFLLGAYATIIPLNYMMYIIFHLTYQYGFLRKYLNAMENIDLHFSLLDKADYQNQ
ncbi:unnamed protein product [Acanthoscelides obtectus]|uniref:Uncharacterized protein n=1 Tax=Acanthoscelides obtectus TaxID=200917 RepID=A0A9P0NTA5_ACAOB|nr:unnamed protein product [Acanthoscelides obtectus]CAK1654983.1 hypothetical protein AOBTE_LOCUS18944 [Acanthoscelides obtectus]